MISSQGSRASTKRRILPIVTAGLAAVACQTPYPPQSVLMVDATAMASTEPVDLKQLAAVAGCSTGSIVDSYTLEVDAVVGPQELCIRGRYGPERVRAQLDPSTHARLSRLRGVEQDIVAGLRSALDGVPLIERNDGWSPVVSTDGLRIVSLGEVDGTPFDSILADVLDDLDVPDDPFPHGEGPDHSIVEHDPEALARFARQAIDDAERYSTFRAPSELRVQWRSLKDAERLAQDALSKVSSCIGERSDKGASVVYWALSLPGGAVYVDSVRPFRAWELHFILLHELMHQHQYALCESGIDLRGIPSDVFHAHANSLALDILRRSGASPAELDLVIELCWLTGGASAQGFDQARAELGLDADDYFRHLSADPAAMERLGRQMYLGMGSCLEPTEPSSGAGPLGFDFVDRAPDGSPLVAITNSTDRPFSGFATGIWHIRSTADRTHYSGGTPFALRLPAGARIVVKSSAKWTGFDIGLPCHMVYRETPAPVFEP